MSLTRMIAPAVLTAGLAFGTYEAIHDVADYNEQADRIAACAQASTQVGSAAISFCQEQPPEAITGEVSSLRYEANTIAFLGVLAGIGAVAGGVVTLAAVTKETRVLEWWAGDGNQE